ncbi:MAG TPA: PHP domain-containing protein [Vicinamibacterales bacterium]|nr:PHP domain-containing protein [Vicinamibacterales bacterium]
MIDLHLHTTASDGLSTPDALVREAAAAGLRTIAVTDHDTIAGVTATAAAARHAGLAFVPGIEMTATVAGRDLHILGYYLDIDDEPLVTFLAARRDERRARVVAIGERLRAIGAPVDLAPILDVPAASGRALGRPAIARALVAAGFAADVADAFDRYLAGGRPAFVTRPSVPPADVIARIHDAGGIASLAHPGKMHVDVLVPEFVGAGLDAIEVYHPDHTPDDTTRYLAMARAHGLLVTGGSDYHGPGSGRTSGLGSVTLPAEAFAALETRARAVRS